MKSGFASRIPENSVGTGFRLAVMAAVGMLLLLAACGPAPPREGTPAFFWAAAKETYAAGDYMKTIDHLDKILESDNEFTARARPWSLLLMSGLASGYMELADKYEAGGKANKAAPGDFYKRVGAYRSMANRLTLHFADSFAAFNKGNDETVTLAFAFPPGSAAPVPQLATVANGHLLPVAGADAAEHRALERGILLATVRAAGAPEDPPKGEQILKQSEGKVPRATFVLAMAKTLFEEAQLYSRQKVNDTTKMTILCQRALEAIKPLPDSHDKKDLDVEIHLTLQKLTT